MNERPEPIGVYRDDGLVARALARTLGRAVPLPAPVLILAGLVPLLAVAALAGGDVSTGVAAGLVAWIVLVCGISGGRPRRAADRLDGAAAAARDRVRDADLGRRGSRAPTAIRRRSR